MKFTFDKLLVALVAIFLCCIGFLHLFFVFSRECFGFMTINRHARSLCHFCTSVATVGVLGRLLHDSEGVKRVSFIGVLIHCSFYSLFLLTGDSFNQWQNIVMLLWLPIAYALADSMNVDV